MFKNHKKINKQKRFFFKLTVRWKKGKRTQIKIWKKDNLQILHVIDQMFQGIPL